MSQFNLVFRLKCFPCRRKCGIKLKDYVVITGYRNAVYNINGFVKDLPDLNTNRGAHGCGHYVNKDMKLVYLVTGGWVGDYVSTTELLIEGASEWTFAGDLPTGRHDLKGASVNNRIFMLGKY